MAETSHLLPVPRGTGQNNTKGQLARGPGRWAETHVDGAVGELTSEKTTIPAAAQLPPAAASCASCATKAGGTVPANLGRRCPSIGRITVHESPGHLDVASPF